MRFSSFILPIGLSAAAVVPRQTENTCKDPVKRVEWRTLGAEVQKQYIDAVLCLKTKPSTLGLSTSRYDDFPYVHTHLDKSSMRLSPPPSNLHCAVLQLHRLTRTTPTVHFVAMFLPWHRLFVQIYEDSLRDCDYTGPMP